MEEFDPRDYFENPGSPRQKQYDALRMYYIEGISQEEAAARAGYSINTFRSLVRDFKAMKIDFFPVLKKGPKERRTPCAVAERIVTLRKENRSIYDIRDILEDAGTPVSIQTIDRIVRDEGFTKLPRRTVHERGITKRNTLLPEKSQQLDFKPDRFDCQVAGIYYFIPYMIQMGLDELVKDGSFPETSQISKLNSVFSILTLKLIGQERLSHIDNFNFDRGFGFFAGLNVLPKPSTISTYSYGIDKQSVNAFMHNFVTMIKALDGDYYGGETINLDFHVIPHFGEGLEKNWISTRNKQMTSALTFLAQDGESKMLNYANADIKRKDAPEEILRFVDHWLGIKGIVDQTLVFDSKLTTYPVLEQLDKDGVKFLTLRRRGEKLIKDALSTPDGWTSVKLDIPKRKYNRFKAYEHKIRLPRTDLWVTEIIIKDHGREEPTFVITNNFEWDITTVVTYYARRWRIENTISDLVDFFSLNSLSSPVTIRIYFDVLLTMVGAILYKLLAQDLKGYEQCTSKELFSKFINTPGKVVVEEDTVTVKMKKKASTPVLKSNEMFRQPWGVPWWDNKVLKFEWIS